MAPVHIYFSQYPPPLLPHTDPVPPNTSQYRPILTQYHHISMSLATRSLATMSLTTIVPREKFCNRLKHKKPRIIIQIRDLHCLLGLVYLCCSCLSIIFYSHFFQKSFLYFLVKMRKRFLKQKYLKM